MRNSMKIKIVHREEVLEVGVWEKIIGGGKHQLQGLTFSSHFTVWQLNPGCLG